LIRQANPVSETNEFLKNTKSPSFHSSSELYLLTINDAQNPPPDSPRSPLGLQAEDSFHGKKRRRAVTPPTDTPPKRFVVESHPTIYRFEELVSGKAERAKQAREYSRTFDKRRQLDPDNSQIKRRQIKHDGGSSPDVFRHINDKQWLNEILLEEQQREIQDAVTRTFLECLYYKVGFIYKQTEKGGYNMEMSPPSFDSKSDKYYLILAKIGEIGITKDDVMYLVGKQSNRWELNRQHHQYQIKGGSNPS
jgi:hypothetical protein